MALDLNALLNTVDNAADKPLPVEQWHPDSCGEMDLLIKADGSWWHEGRPFQRFALVKLFARILRREPDGRYCLVTPAEKVLIQVEDVPFLIQACHQQEQGIQLITNCEEVLWLGSEHPLQMRPYPGSKDLCPYVRVRAELWARVERNVYYQLIEMATPLQTEQGTDWQLTSQNQAFSLGIVADD
ncbi:DUF1285 domain-containing protein [Balneatrix alpica]|uniref:DUF1285 domain-containing protein n=1 Tax=Balneatrix alpica TaxID=75684 RepID=A0ABV5ZAH0_9GAMM|nr:DUF1285 domain-containing protein [Balneatrix alpica]